MATTRLLSAMVATWNNVATTFTGLNLNVTDTASAVGSMLMDLQVNSSPKFGVNKFGGINAYGNLALLSNAGSVFFGAGLDLVITRDAANTLALRNGVNAQAFNVYNTYTDASNYERGIALWSGNVFILGTQSAGSGAARGLAFLTNGVGRWNVDTSGHFTAVADNTYDIGAGGANRPRNVYVAGTILAGSSITGANMIAFDAGSIGWNSRIRMFSAVDGTLRITNNAGTQTVDLTVGASNLLTLNGGLTVAGGVTAGTSVVVGAGNSYYFSGRSQITSPTNGNLTLTNNAGTDFGLLQFGGTTSSFPALRRTGAALDVVLADASAYSAINASQFISQTSGFKFNASTQMSAPADGLFRLLNKAGTDFTRLILGTNDTSGIAIKKHGTSFSFVLGDDSAFASVAMKDITTSNTTFLHATSASLANGAAAQVATMTNGPTAGNPTKWIAINDNGTTRYIPAW